MMSCEFSSGCQPLDCPTTSSATFSYRLLGGWRRATAGTGTLSFRSDRARSRAAAASFSAQLPSRQNHRTRAPRVVGSPSAEPTDPLSAARRTRLALTATHPAEPVAPSTPQSSWRSRPSVGETHVGMVRYSSATRLMMISSLRPEPEEPQLLVVASRSLDDRFSRRRRERGRKHRQLSSRGSVVARLRKIMAGAAGGLRRVAVARVTAHVPARRVSRRRHGSSCSEARRGGAAAATMIFRRYGRGPQGRHRGRLGRRARGAPAAHTGGQAPRGRRGAVCARARGRRLYKNRPRRCAARGAGGLRRRSID